MPIATAALKPSVQVFTTARGITWTVLRYPLNVLTIFDNGRARCIEVFGRAVR